jgi:SOS response regulatory protein OraA/RecX
VDRVSDWKYCSQWLDDAPFVRAECKEHLEKGRSCENCQHRNIRQEVMDLRAALREGVPRLQEARELILEMLEFQSKPAAAKTIERIQAFLAQEGTPTGSEP